MRYCVIKHSVDYLFWNWHATLANVVVEFVTPNSVVHILIHEKKQFSNNLRWNFQWCVPLIQILWWPLICISKLRHAHGFVWSLSP